MARSAAARARKPVDQYRRALYAKIQIAKKQLQLDEDTYRDLLEKQTGKRSLKDLRNPQLVDLVEHFRTLGFKPKSTRPPKRAGRERLADAPIAKKARALWISLYHLGCVSDPSEKALGAFVKRQAGVDDLRFLHDEQPVVEALKAWAARPVEKGGAGVSWSSYAAWGPGGHYTIEKPRQRVMEAQWHLLHRFGRVKYRDTGALESWVSKFLHKPTGYFRLEDDDADRVIEALGQMVREARAKEV